MKNLGKIVLFFIFIAISTLNAGVKATVDSTSVSVGELVTINLTITGEDIQKPNLLSICGSDIVSSSSQTSIQMINMDYKKNYVLSYKFMPQKSCTIEPIELEIDGKTQTTDPIDIIVQAYVRTQNDDFILTFETDKTDLHVGEPFDLTLTFKQKKDVQAVDSKFVAPDFKGFWIKAESQPKRYKQDDHIITQVIYTMAAQRPGTLMIEPAQMKIASRVNSRDSWGSWAANVKWRTYFSNDLNITASPLPNGAELVGDFVINAKVDKTTISPNEAVNVTIEVLGSGNLEDVKSFKPYIQGVSVFDEKIVVAGNKLTQKIAFVSDSDFTIPPFTLEYFDLKSKEVKQIKTENIVLHVEGSVPKKELKIKRAENQTVPEVKTVEVVTSELSTLHVVLVFLVGFVSAVVLMLLKPWEYLKREKKLSIKDPKVLLVKLMPFKDDEKVQSLVDVLEKNLYSDAKIELDKNLLKECIRKHNIS